MEWTLYDLAERFVGLKEAKGPTSNSQVLAMLQLDTGWVVDDETPWCLTGDTQILTANGFVNLGSLKDGAEVAQVDPFLRISWAVPTRYIHKPYRGRLVHLRHRSLDLVCDPQHRFFGVWNRANAQAGPVELRPITDLTSSLFVPRVSTENEIDAPEWADSDLALLAAFISDGFFHRGRIAVQVSKARKLEALYALAPAHVYEAKQAYGARTAVPLTTFYYEPPSWSKTAFSDYKVPKYDLLRRLSRRQLTYLLDAYLTFDGHAHGGSARLYTSLPALRDWLQMAATLAGYHSSFRRSSVSPFTGRPCDEVVIPKDKACRILRPDMVEEFDGETELHCVSVPSGVIVIRDRGGMVMPVGNCSAAMNYWAWLMRLPRSKNLSARSWLSVGTVIPRIEEARRGFDVIILKRGDPDQPGPEVLQAPGHVGLFSGLEQGLVWVLGGNQSDSVSVACFPVERLLGIRRLLEEQP